MRLWACLGCAAWAAAMLPGCGGGGGSSIQRAATILARSPNGDNGQIASANTAVTLSLRLTSPDGAPVASRGVVFVAPAAGPAGTFANPTALGPNTTRVVTTPDGVATAALTTNGIAGPFLVSALIEDTGVSFTLAVTNAPAGSTPSLVPRQARTAAEGRLLAGKAEDDFTKLHGPVLLPAGTIVSTPGRNIDGSAFAPITLGKQSWFLWSDDRADHLFAHAARFVLLDASDAAAGFESRAQIRSASWWPELAIPGQPARPLLPANMLDGSLPPPSRAARSAPGVNRATRAPNDTYAIVVHGPHGVTDSQGNTTPGSNFDNDAQTYRDTLVSTGKVNPANVLPQQDTSFPVRRSDIKDMVDAAQAAGAKKLYFFLQCHGDTTGVALLGPQGTVDVVSWNDLADILARFKGELFVYCGACFSGLLVDALANRGITGQIVTASSSKGETTTDNEAPKPHTPFVEAFTDAMKNPDADTSSPKDGVDLIEAGNWVLRHAGEGKSNPDKFKSEVLDGDPQVKPITPGHASGYSLPGVGINTVGSTVDVTINYQKPATPDQKFTVTVQIADGSVAQFADGTTTAHLDLNAGGPKTVTIKALQKGQTTYSLTGQAGPNHFDSGPTPLYVGSQLGGNPNGKVIYVGETAVVNVVRSGAIALSPAALAVTVISRNTGTLTVAPLSVTFAPGITAMPVTITGQFTPGIATVDLADPANGVNGTFIAEVRQKLTLNAAVSAGGTTWNKGDVITSDRITNYHIAAPDACGSWHMHSNGGTGIFIDGKGPITDPDPTGCGYGLVIQPPK